MNYYNDNDPFAAQWLRNLIEAGLIPKGYVDERSITEIDPESLRAYTQCHFFAGIGGWPYAMQIAGWPTDRPVWTGSCPCQPISGAGKHKGEKDERHLWPEFYRLIGEYRPAKIFGEQVAGSDGLEWLDGISLDLEELGYAVGAVDFCAAGVGATQIRPRIWWVADADCTRRQGAIRQRQPHKTRQQREIACGEPLRSTCGYWPPGPGEVHKIPLLANGIPGVMGACKAYGNAIVPQVAAEFITAYLEATTPKKEVPN